MTSAGVIFGPDPTPWGVGLTIAGNVFWSGSAIRAIWTHRKGIKKAFNGAVSFAKNTGKAIADGVVGGISNSAKKLWNKVLVDRRRM